MTEDTKQFIIKVLVAGVVIVVLYFVFSPYQNCVRIGDAKAACMINTSW